MPIVASFAGVGFTSEGGRAIKLTNRTGGTSIKGYGVRASRSYDSAFEYIEPNIPDVIGYVYGDTEGNQVADGEECWIVQEGIAEVYFDSNGVTRGDLVRGYITADGGSPVSGQMLGEAVPTSPFANDKHFYEGGHALESRVGAGLAKVNPHFN